MSKSKSFCVAVEGQTATDGRTIERSWIEDIAAGYNRATYGARVNMEHYRGFSPEPPFNAYGDVLSVEKREIEIELNGVKEKRLALFAVIEPTDALVKLTKAKQKIYTSIEVAPNFAGTGKAGLVGLAVTDTPASLGTDILQFSATADNAAAAQLKEAFDARKQDKANVFSATGEPVVIEFEAEAAPTETGLDKFIALLTSRFATPEQPKTPDPKVELKTADQAGLAEMFKGLTEALAADRAADRAADAARFAELTGTITTLKAELEAAPNPLHIYRPVASGAGAEGKFSTDC